MAVASDDVWQVFGSDSSDDEEKEDSNNTQQQQQQQKALAVLRQYWLQLDPHVAQRRIGCCCCSQEKFALIQPLAWIECIDDKSHSRKSNKTEEKSILLDATFEDCLRNSVVRGGFFVATSDRMNLVSDADDDDDNDWELWQMVANSFCVYQKKTVKIQAHTCPWLPGAYNIEHEKARLAAATVVLSAYEQQQQSMVLNRTDNDISDAMLQLTERSIREAVENIRATGYCVFRGNMVHPQDSFRYGAAALGDLSQAATILKEKTGCDLYNPSTTFEHKDGDNGNSETVLESYRELSPREDYRADIRHGPRLDSLRGPNSRPRTFRASERGDTDDFLRGHAGLLEVIRRVMNPVDDNLARGNVGRYNFGGNGPDGSYQDLRVGPVGSIVSLPGAADQALHADTPHLFEHSTCLPAHYMNIFTPAWQPSSSGPVVGQTALLHATHRLDVTAERWEDRSKLWKEHLVRPLLEPGDVLLFDCRILHFGLRNDPRSEIERPLLYTNVTMHWFHDPKNWDEYKSVFELIDDDA